MRNQDDHQLAALLVDALTRKKAANNRNAGKTGDTGDLLTLLLVDQTGQQADFTVTHAYRVVHLALSNDRLADAAQIDISRNARDIQIGFERDIAIVVNARYDLHVDAHIDELELRIHQRVDTHAADAGLEATGCGGLALADFQSGLYIVHRPELGRLQHSGVGIAEGRFQQSAGKVDREIGTS